MKPNILVVCGRNKIRSKTAEHIFRNDNRFNIRSVGLNAASDRKIKIKDIKWANYILVMEDKYKARIVDNYQEIIKPKIFVLDISDDYKYMDAELCEVLRIKINNIISSLL